MEWFDQIGEILKPLLGDPGTASFMLKMFVGCLVYLVIFRTAASGFGVEVNEWPHTLFASGITLAAVLAAVVASRLYTSWDILPAPWQEPAIALVVLLVIGLPVHCLIMRSNVVKIFLSILMGAIAGGLMVVLVGIIGNALKSGDRTVSPARKRKQELEQMINQ